MDIVYPISSLLPHPTPSLHIYDPQHYHHHYFTEKKIPTKTRGLINLTIWFISGETGIKPEYFDSVFRDLSPAPLKTALSLRTTYQKEGPIGVDSVNPDNTEKVLICILRGKRRWFIMASSNLVNFYYEVSNTMDFILSVLHNLFQSPLLH